MSAWASIFLTLLVPGHPDERLVRRKIVAVADAWRELRHVRRVVLVDGHPALRFERLDQLRIDWSVNSQTVRTVPAREHTVVPKRRGRDLTRGNQTR